MTAFVPRSIFPSLDSLPRSYYLGHHAAGLSKMRAMLSQIDFIVECRDYRIPLTSRNPLFEHTLAGRQRIIVYTKKDLGSIGGTEEIERHRIVREWHHPSKVVFSDHKNAQDTRKILELIKKASNDRGSLTGSHLIVVGMPNVGKSSLLNALRREGVGKGKVAHTGAQPGVTRKIGTGVKIVEGQDGSGGVYLMDTPGVFMPYVPDAEAMLKLALCGSVKDTIIPPFNLADYLLFHINLQEPRVYSDYSQPTNNIMDLLEAMARKTGRLQKGGAADLEATALWMVQRWRNGYLGTFTLDHVTEDGMRQHQASEALRVGSMNQARKADKEAQRVRARTKRAASSSV